MHITITTLYNNTITINPINIRVTKEGYTCYLNTKDKQWIITEETYNNLLLILNAIDITKVKLLDKNASYEEGDIVLEGGEFFRVSKGDHSLALKQIK